MLCGGQREGETQTRTARRRQWEATAAKTGPDPNPRSRGLAGSGAAGSRGVSARKEGGRNRGMRARRAGASPALPGCSSSRRRGPLTHCPVGAGSVVRGRVPASAAEPGTGCPPRSRGQRQKLPRRNSDSRSSGVPARAPSVPAGPLASPALPRSGDVGAPSRIAPGPRGRLLRHGQMRTRFLPI